MRVSSALRAFLPVVSACALSPHGSAWAQNVLRPVPSAAATPPSVAGAASCGRLDLPQPPLTAGRGLAVLSPVAALAPAPAPRMAVPAAARTSSPAAATTSERPAPASTSLRRAALALSGDAEAGRELPGLAHLASPGDSAADTDAGGTGLRQSAEAEFNRRAGLDAQVPTAAVGAGEDGAAVDRYLEELLGRTRRLYARFFPGFDREFPVEMVFSRQRKKDVIEGSHYANVRRKPTTHEITLLEKEAPSGSNELERVLTPMSRHAEKNPELFNAAIRRRNARILVLFHEYAHAIFHEATPAVSRGLGMPEQDFMRVDVSMALDEGFAVMMELLLIDKMLADAEELGLDPQDVSDLRIRKEQRILGMRHDNKLRHDHYAEGTFFFMHKIYKQEGEAGLLRFLADLDLERLYTTFTYDPAYRLIQGSPQLFKAYLTKSGDPRLRAGVDALAAYLAGSPSQGDDARLKDVLAHVQMSALMRIARLYINTAEAKSDPSIYRGFVDRVARLSPEKAQNFRAYP